MNDFNYAGFWWRFLAILIDSLILLIPSLIIGVIIGLVVGIPLMLTGLDLSAVKALNQLAGFIGGILISWLYHATLESSPWQATLGKKICGLTVTDLDGNRLSFGQATKRAFARQLSGLILDIGFIMAAFSPRKQGLHDKIAHTLVLKRTN